MHFHKQYQYNEQIIGLFIDALAAHPESPEEVRRNLSHILNALHLWLCRIHGTQPVFGVWQEHDSVQMHAINRDAHAAIFSLLESGNLHGMVSYTNSLGERYSSTLDEILCHLIIHSAHHRAQISAAWRGAGIEPPISDFIHWARTR